MTFENVGVGAYLGAAGFIKDKSVLQAAAGIFGVEARHAAVVANLLGLPAEGGVYKGAYETPIAQADVLAAVTPFLMSQMGTVPTGGVQTGGGACGGEGPDRAVRARWGGAARRRRCRGLRRPAPRRRGDRPDLIPAPPVSPASGVPSR